MRVASLFAGIGGFDLAADRAGFDPALQVEINTKCRSILARHWPSVDRLEDVRDVESLPAVDLICGGSPCQDVSVAGARAGLDGGKSKLFYEFIRLADSRPRAWILFENVPGLLSSNSGGDWAISLEGFTGVLPETPRRWQTGGVCVGPYRWVAWRVLDAQYFGLAQRRKRLFAVAGPRDFPAPEILFEPGCLPGDSPPREETGAPATCLTAGSPGGSGYRLDDGQLGQLVVPLTARADSSEDGTSRGSPLVVDVSQITSPDNRSVPGQQSPTIAASSEIVAFNALQDPISGQIPGALDSDGSSSAIVAFRDHGLGCVGDTPGPLGYRPERIGIAQETIAPRRLTPLEFERLQGFPDDWTAEGADGVEISDAARYHALGNAVAVPVVEWICRRLVVAMRRAAA